MTSHSSKKPSNPQPADAERVSAYLSRTEMLKKVIATLERDAVRSKPAATNPNKATPAPKPQIIAADWALETAEAHAVTQELALAAETTPWLLDLFQKGEIDLDAELTRRYPTVPLLSTIKFRQLGSQNHLRVATLATQDGASHVTIEAHTPHSPILMSFTNGSMLSLRFELKDLSSMSRERWIESMSRLDQDSLAFLWGDQRWNQDYVICIKHKYFTNLYAFSPKHFEAAVRLTPAVMIEWVAWLSGIWQQQDEQINTPEADNAISSNLVW